MVGAGVKQAIPPKLQACDLCFSLELDGTWGGSCEEPEQPSEGLGGAEPLLEERCGSGLEHGGHGSSATTEFTSVGFILSKTTPSLCAGMLHLLHRWEPGASSTILLSCHHLLLKNVKRGSVQINDRSPACS